MPRPSSVNSITGPTKPLRKRRPAPALVSDAERRAASQSTRAAGKPRKVRPTLSAVLNGGKGYETRTKSGNYTQRKYRAELAKSLERRSPEAYKPSGLSLNSSRQDRAEISRSLLFDQRRRREATEDDFAEKLLAKGVVGLIDEDVSDVGRKIVFGSENPNAKDYATTAALTVATAGAGGAAGAALRKVAPKGIKVAKGAVTGTKASKPAAAVRKAKNAAGTPKRAVNRKVAPAKARAGVGVKAAVPKPAKAVGRGALRVVRTKPARVVGKAAKITSAPVRAPLRVVSRHPGKSAFGAFAGPGAVSATTHQDSNRALAPFEALAHSDPLKIGKTTVRSLPGLVAAPVGMAANVGLSGYRAGATATGLKKYSGKEILEPTKKVAEETKDFATEMGTTLGSGDTKRIAKALEENYGLTPFAIAGIPGLHAARKAGAGRVAGRAGRKVAPKTAQRLDNRKARILVSREAAYADRRGRGEAAPHINAVQKRLRKVDRKHRRDKSMRADAQDTVKLVAEEGLTNATQLAAVRKTLDDERPDVDGITRHDAAEYLEAHPQLFKDKHYQAAVEAYRASAKEIESSVRAKHGNQALTHGVKLPEERYLQERTVAAKLGNANSTKRRRAEEIIEKQAERDFLLEMKKVRKREGLAEPSYTADLDLARRDSLEGLPKYNNDKRMAARQHEKKFVLRERGTADQSFDALAQKSILSPRMRRSVHQNTKAFVDREAVPVLVKGKKRRYLSSSQIREAKFDPKTHAVLDSQHFKQAVLDPRTTVDDFVGYGDRSLKNEIVVKDVNPAAKGKRYVVIEKSRLKEFVDQHRGLEGAWRGLAKGQRAASRAILGYSPSWLALQPVAELAQARSAVPFNRMVRGSLDYQKMSPAGKREFDATFGATAGTGAIKDTASSLHGDVTPSTRIGQSLQKTAAGRVVHGLLTARYSSEIDHMKGISIRRAVAAGRLSKEYSFFQRGMKGIIRENEKVSKLSGPERLAYFTKNAPARRRMERYVDDVMGNWTALTARERKLSTIVIFYPFVRMSLQWTFKTFPKNHPYKAAIQHFLAQSNANQLKETLNGDPSFFSQWANAPIYGGKDGEATGIMPLNRIAPGSNALIEAVGDNPTPAGLTKAANPILGSGIAAYAGQDPLTGRSVREKGEKVNTPDFLRSWAAQLASLPAPVRAADAATGKKVSRGVKGQAVTPITELFDKLQNDGRLSPAVRSHLAPLAPLSASRQKQMTEIGRLLDRKYKVTGPESLKGLSKEDAAKRMTDSQKADDKLDYILKRYAVNTKDPEWNRAIKSYYEGLGD